MVLSLVLPWLLVYFQVHLLCSASCQQVVLGLHPSPSGEASASTCRLSSHHVTAGPLAVVLHGAASLRGFFPLSLVLPLPGSVTFLALVPHLEALLESLALSIPHSFLVVALSAPAVSFAVALWLWPERALRRFSWRQSRWSILSHCRPSCTVSLLTVSVIGARFAYAVGRSPHAFRSIGTLGGLRWPHLYRLTPELVGLRRFATWLWDSGRCFLFFLCDVPHVSMAIN